jgi:hypothetical protein
VHPQRGAEGRVIPFWVINGEVGLGDEVGNAIELISGGQVGVEREVRSEEVEKGEVYRWVLQSCAFAEVARGDFRSAIRKQS